MKSSLLYIFVGIVLLIALIAGLVFIPISSKSLGCGSDRRFSIIKGELGDYNSIKSQYRNINAALCTGDGNYTLYVF